MKNAEHRGAELLRRFRKLSQHFIAREQEFVRMAWALGRHGESVIHSLGEEDEITMGALARTIGLSLSSMTDIIDGLEKNGFVTRVRSAADRRVIHLRLTPNGRRVYRRGFDAQVRFASALLSILTRKEQDLLLSLHRKIDEGMNAKTPKAKP